MFYEECGREKGSKLMKCNQQLVSRALEVEPRFIKAMEKFKSCRREVWVELVWEDGGGGGGGGGLVEFRN